MEKLTNDDGVTKRIIRSGLGVKPETTNLVSVHYEAFLFDNNEKFDSSRDKKEEFTFQLRDAKVIEAWELAIPTMQVGEVAEIICTSDYGYGDEGRKYLVPAKAKLRFEVELIGFWEKPGSAAERLRSAEKKKMEGNELFKAGATNQALFAYRKAREYIKDMWNCEPEELEEARHIMVAVQLNIGACYLKLKNYDFAIEVCKKALERDATKIKAYYRLGQAYMEKDEYDVSISYIKLGLEQRTKDQSLLTLLNTVEKKQQKWINNSTSLYRKMFNTPQEDI